MDRTFFLVIGMDSSCKKSESKSALEGIPWDFLWRLRRNFRLYRSLSLSHVVLAGSILARLFPGFNIESPSIENSFYFLLQGREFTWRVGAHTSIMNIGVLQDSLEDGRLEERGGNLG